MVKCNDLTHISSAYPPMRLLRFAQNAKKIVQSLTTTLIVLGEMGQLGIDLTAKNVGGLGLDNKNQDRYIVRSFQAAFKLVKFAIIKSRLMNFIQTDALMMVLKNTEHLVNLAYWRVLKLIKRQYIKQNLKKDHLLQKTLYLAYLIMRLKESSTLGSILILFTYWGFTKNNQATAQLAG